MSDDTVQAAVKPIPNRRGITPTQHVVAILVVAGYFALVAILCFKDMPQGNVQPLNIALGALGAGFSLVLSFYFTNMTGARAPAPTPPATA